MTMGRREFLGTVASLAPLAMAGGAFATGKKTDRPNIILFISDDHGYADSGVYGDKYVRTPNIDRLATQSMRFTHAYAASPLCVPSRCVIQSGLMPHRNGAHAFGTGIKEAVKLMPDYFRELGYHTAHVGKWHHGKGKMPVYDYKDADVHKAVNVIAGHDKAKPLFLVACTKPPHLPWAKNTTYDLNKIKLPPNFVDTPETRQCRAEYYTDVTLMDGILGKVLAAAKNHGFDDNTLVLYTSDQGANWPFAKWCVYDAGLRVPFMVRWPGKVKADTVTDAMVSFCDILPTCVQVAGGKPPADIDGRGFLDVLTGKTDKHRKHVFGTHTGYTTGFNGVNNHSPARTIITPTHQYILNLDSGRVFDTHITGCKPTSRWYVAFWDSWVAKAKTDPAAKAIVDAYRHRPVEELYDLRSDPYERKNLADDPEYARMKATMRKQIDAWRKQQEDDVPLILPDGQQKERD